MNRAYIPGVALTDDQQVEMLDKDFIRGADDGQPFHIGQSYEQRPAAQQECSRCGGKEFNVGLASYYTAIRCVNCCWEFVVHEG